MRLEVLSPSQLYFPKSEWQILRAEREFDASAPDAFLFAVELETGGAKTFWAWSPRGCSVRFTDADTKVPVLVLNLSNEMPLEQRELAAFGLYLKTSFEAQPAHDSEWISALQVLSNRFQFDPAARNTLPPYWSEAMVACGLNPHLGALAQRMRFIGLHVDELSTLFTKKWDPSVFELLETLPDAIRLEVRIAIERSGLSASNAKEAIQLVLILNKRLGPNAASTLLKSTYRSGEEFRLALLHTAQPEMARMSEKRVELLRSLKTPPRCSVFGDPTFEKDALKITHTPKNLGDFDTFKAWVNEPELPTKIKALLEVYGAN